MEKQQKHKHLVKFLSKQDEEAIKKALDNLLDKQMIGIREYKQILKEIVKQQQLAYEQKENN
jgi:DNA-directed RNA polymerase subunit F